MRGKTSASALALGVAVAALCTTGCQKSADPRSEADQTELRSAENVAETTKETTAPKNDYLVVVRREQLDLRARLHAELDELDQRLGALNVDAKKDGGPIVDPRSKDAANVRGLLARRGKLQADLAAIEHADERGWDLLKANVERDLANAPPRRGRI